ncbi:hypothetical protein [Sphingomonas panaciterrae]|uniref:hypothetical protein n=1 Tax=Sphingomonas panaciterrae TaxID=1462999 RepID=UPI002FEF8150
MSGRRYTMFSAGQGSFRAAMIDRAQHPDAEYGLVFTDTLYEDADAYRFLIEGAAQVLGRRLNWTVRADDAPDYRVSADTPIEEYRGNPEWRAWLADLRERAMDALPGLIWLVEGRDPWEIFRDRRFLGNSLRDPCSEVAKREVADAWRVGHCHRVGELFEPADWFAVGIDESEAHRFFDGNGGGLGPRMAADGWQYHAPLIDLNARIKAGERVPGEILSLAYAPLDQIGPASPRLYGMGYKHNNCGGWCVKAGQAHYANRFRVQPKRYAYDALMEQKMRAYLGADVSMLTDRRGGTGKRPMTLAEFAERLRADPGASYEYQPGESGCGCMVSA